MLKPSDSNLMSNDFSGRLFCKKKYFLRTKNERVSFSTLSQALTMKAFNALVFELLGEIAIFIKNYS